MAAPVCEVALAIEAEILFAILRHTLLRLLLRRNDKHNKKHKTGKKIKAESAAAACWRLTEADISRPTNAQI